MRVIEKIEVSKLKYGCVVVTKNFLFHYSLFKIILNPSKKDEFSSENQKDMSVDGKSVWHGFTLRSIFWLAQSQLVIHSWIMYKIKEVGG